MEVNLSIIDMDQYLPRRDYRHIHWVRFEVDLLSHPDFFRLSAVEFKVFFHFICIAGKMQNDSIRMDIEHVSHQLQVPQNAIVQCISKLEGKRWKSLDRTDSVRGHEGDMKLSEPERREEKRREDNIYAQQIEQFYAEHYPRKIGKTKGVQKILKDWQESDSMEDLKKAILNYSYSTKGNEEKYIKHFSTWASEWRDWIVGAEPTVKNLSEEHQAQKILNGVKKFSQDETEKLREFLGEILFKKYLDLGGRRFVGNLQDNEFGRKQLAQALKQSPQSEAPK